MPRHGEHGQTGRTQWAGPAGWRPGRARLLLAVLSLAGGLLGAGCAGPRQRGPEGAASPEEGRSTSAAGTVPSARSAPEEGGAPPPDTSGGVPERLDLAHLPDGCTLKGECAGLVQVDCGVAADGPLYYAEKASGRVLEVCGGACMAPRTPESRYCTECPPPAWTCAE